jgi:hypothetical protein
MQRCRYADLVLKRRSTTAGCTDDISMSQPQASHALDSRGDANIWSKHIKYGRTTLQV